MVKSILFVQKLVSKKLRRINVRIWRAVLIHRQKYFTSRCRHSVIILRLLKQFFFVFRVPLAHLFVDQDRVLLT